MCCAEAIDAAIARPPYLRDELLLAPTPTAPATARGFVQQAGVYWQLAEAWGVHHRCSGGKVVWCTLNR